jgi:NADPH:quinone reductase-like Zn-dependent oxidoreductase
MQAMIYTQYGPPDVLHAAQLEKPAPKPKEILIKVHTSAVNSADWRLRKPDPYAVRLFFGLTKPRKQILGGILAGEVEQIGSAVTRYKVGDRVFGSTGMGMGAYAEYRCLPENGILAKIPTKTSFEEAAAIPFGGMTALFFLRKAAVKKGEKVLVYGASGAVGSAAVQIALALGAEVTGVCSTTNVEMVKRLGAVKVIDYTQQDFSQSGEVYDCVMDTVSKMPLESVPKVLKEKGRLILSDAGVKETLWGIKTNITGKWKVLFGMAQEEAEQVAFLGELVETGKMKAVIDRIYTLDQLVEAHRYVEGGHKKGNVVIRVAGQTE